MSEPSGTQYGGFWVRLIALLADSAIVFLVSAALLFGAAMALDAEALVPVVFAVWLIGLLYWPVMHASKRQATFGKAIVGLKVARLDGRRIGILRSLWREIAKLFSAAVLMLGYLMAAVTPRKQGLHDLMAATYVVREGPARVIPALTVAIAGFAVPVLVGPMIGAAVVMSTMTSLAEGMVAEHAPMMQAALPTAPAPKPAPKLAVKPAAKVQPVPAKPAAAPAPAPVAVVQAAPVPVAEPAKPKTETAKPAPEPVKPEPAKPEPVVVAEAAPLPVAEPKAKPAAKPKAAAATPNAVPAKPRPAATMAVARASRAPAPKQASGLKYNDLMTAVLYGDVDGVNELLQLGKWADKPDSRGTTPLMMAAERGDVRTAEALLRGGANAKRALPVAEENGNDEMLLLLKRYSGR
jgi:uncharacterized RDD family membrane protein YckC